ncbi:uncharacterized protein LOC114358924 [Ostrinia furnacalis]|uniref:uncharacterized protein LOC114358924 n=1 Tax=Ostrinia furnacalis TaxID=93504 RepID=UPI00103AACC0|nr:uncharacterized protein LOC114358924 [Ostrinia furnacalis]
MLSATVAALACLCLARTSPAEPQNLRLYAKTIVNQKDLSGVLASIDERLRVLDAVSAAQVKQARRLDVIQDKLDRVETALSLKLERAQLAAERLEHRLHMLQTSVQTSIKESSDKLERTQTSLVELAQNLTSQIDLHRRLLDKVNGAYADTWHRGLVLESLMRDGLSLVNVTRRELADGLRALARRQGHARFAPLDTGLARQINDNTNKIDAKMNVLLDAQKRYVDSCQRVQLDDPNQVADVLGKLIDTLINKTASTFHELQNIQVTIKNHDAKVTKLLNSGRNNVQSDSTCRRLETIMRNSTKPSFKETELQQLTEKLVDLTNRADAALQRLETRLKDDGDGPAPNITAAADQLLLKLNSIKGEQEYDDEFNWEDDDPEYSFYDDGGGGDMMDEDKKILSSRSLDKGTESPTERPPHRRHLHKHPYDRGPSRGN